MQFSLLEANPDVNPKIPRSVEIYAGVPSVFTLSKGQFGVVVSSISIDLLKQQASLELR